MESGERGVCLWAGGARGRSRDRVDAGIKSDRRCGPWAISSFAAVPHQKRAVRTVFYTPNTHRPRLAFGLFSPSGLAPWTALRPRADYAGACGPPPCLPFLHVLAMATGRCITLCNSRADQVASLSLTADGKWQHFQLF